MTTNVRLFATALMAIAAGCGVADRKSDPTMSKRSTSSQSQSEGNEVIPGPNEANEQAPDRFRVRFETSQGDFVVDVHREWAPHGADRFYNLAKIGFFDECRFFRVVPGFVVQFGLNGDPDVQATWTRTLPDDPVTQSNTRGMLTYAKTPQPNSRSTQVFINLTDNPGLDGDGFAPFGRVVEGINVVDKLYDGYGDAQGPQQGRIQTEGNAYLQREFPKLDFIKRAVLVEPESSTENSAENR